MYKASRLRAEMTQESALSYLLMGHRKQLQRIETGETKAQPDTVLLMAKAYRDPLLPLRYCKDECPIGQVYHHQITEKALSTTVLQVINAINVVQTICNDLISIAEDELITPDEIPRLTEHLGKLLKLEHGIGEFKMCVSNVVDLGQMMKSKNGPAAKQMSR